MSTRASRRVAARRTAIVESSDEEMANTTQKPDESEDEFAPAPAASPRRSTQGRRRTMASEAPTTPPKRRPGRPRKSVAPAQSVEPSEVFDPDQTAGPADQEAIEATKKPSPKKRKSIAPRATTAATSELPPPLPTPKASQSPEESTIRGSPLSDITSTTINEHMRLGDDAVQAAVKPIKAMDTILEKPMDIMLKSRTMMNLNVPMPEDTGPKPRIVITHLMLTNFKSYAGRQEVGPFHASFSSVVGPNGSGKSNVIDSLLFVFGFRASKMRQGKISALIHNSAQHPDLEYCEVAVHFQEVIDVVSDTTTFCELCTNKWLVWRHSSSHP